MNILIVTGGISSERKISLISAKAVKEGLEKSSHSVKLFDLKNGYEELEKVIKNFDVIFPVLHGEEGEGGELQKFLFNRKVAFVGGDWRGFKEGWFKISFKKFCNKNRILTSPWKAAKTKQDVIAFGFPSVLKSSSGGSSREVVILKSAADLNRMITKKLLGSTDLLFIEKFLPGIEVTVAVLNNKALPVLEIIPTNGAWFDYKNKYSGRTQEIPFAPSVDKGIQEKVQKIATFIHKKLKLGHYSRTDFIIHEDKPYVLEINTIPGLTPESLFPKAAKAIGIDFPKLVNQLVELAYAKSN